MRTEHLQCVADLCALTYTRVCRACVHLSVSSLVLGQGGGSGSGGPSALGVVQQLGLLAGHQP